MKKRKNKKGFLIGGIAAGAVVILAGGGILAWKLLINTATPQETVKNYFALVEKGQYDKMYAMLSERTRETVSEKEFTERNQNIYEGIEAKDIKISLSEREKLKGSPVTVKYSETMQTSAEEISFDNEMTLQKEDGEYKIDWDSTIIFPNLQDSYKVQIQTESADRGTIYDRNGVVLAVPTTVCVFPTSMASNMFLTVSLGRTPNAYSCSRHYNNPPTRICQAPATGVHLIERQHMNDTPHRILVVDDEPSITEFVSYALKKEGFFTDVVDNGEDALALATKNSYDLFVLDIMLPGMDGYELCRRLRSKTTVPVLFLSARDTELDKVVGLEIGGDDYLAKPFGVRELIARVRALLRRGSGGDFPGANHAVTASGITLDEDAHTASGANGEIDLTPREFELLASLMKNAGKVVSREDLLRDAWGWEYLTETKTVDTHIKRLRDKIESAGYDPGLVETVRGYGYRFKQ